MRTIDELPAWAQALLEAERVARLGFVDDEDHPRVLPVTFAVAEGAVFSAIDDVKAKSSAEPARLRYLRRRPRAALCVDHYDDDWTRLAWVQVLGVVDVLEVGNAPAGLAALVGRYPAYREQRPQGPVLRLRAERVLSWSAP